MVTADKLNEVLDYAALAPSSHNTQPWLVRVKDASLTVGYDPDRQLRIGDTDKRELFISLGCFIETTILAASALGYKVNYRFDSNRPDKVATLRFATTKPVGENWLELIKNRRSERRQFLDKPIPGKVLESFGDLRQNQASVAIVNKSYQIELLAELTRQATLAFMGQQAFRNELAQWVRNNWTRRPDGMPGYTQGMPGPVSLLAKPVITKTNKATADQAKKDSRRVANAAAVALVCTNENSATGWLDAGRLLQRLWLSATAKDIKASAISAAVIWPDTAKQMNAELNLSTAPVALLRLGYFPATAKASPRLRPQQFSR